MPRDLKLGDRFKVQKWKWYVVDFRDLHDPILIRKHFDNKPQAKVFINKYYDTKNFDIIHWKAAQELGLRDYPWFSKRHHKIHTAKYDYPFDCRTQLQRQIFRNNERKKMKQQKRLPKVTETAVWDIMDDKPVLFMKRLKTYRDNHWAYTEPVEGLNIFKKKYEWPKDIRHLCNIVRTLREYYDLGLYDVAQVAIFIYKKWGARIRSHCGGVGSIPRDEEKVAKELIARGFEIKSEMDFFEEESYIETILLKPILAHPEICWHSSNEKKLYDHYVYDFQSRMGIAGYVRAHVAGLEKRK